MKLLLSVATIVLLVALGTMPRDVHSGPSSEAIELASIRSAGRLALSELLEIQGDLSALVNDLTWLIYENDIHYEFRLRMGEQINTVASVLEDKVNTLAGLMANFVPVIDEVANAKRLVEEFAEKDELAYYADEAYDRATDMLRTVELLIQELQVITDDLAQTPGAQEGDSDARIEG